MVVKGFYEDDNGYSLIPGLFMRQDWKIMRVYLVGD